MISVKIYTTPSCAYCKLAKEYFKANNIQYEEYDVFRDRARADEMIKKSGQMGVPVIDIDGKFVIGFDRAKINEYLGLGQNLKKAA